MEGCWTGGSWSMEEGRLKGLEGELGFHSTACRRVRREEDGEKPHLMK
jgi:hypothetical protein